MNSAWGRFVYYADLGKYSGPGVYLEALPINHIIKWNSSLDPYRKRELEALRKDGHEVRQIKRGWEISTTPDTVRNTQLFRTLPHEFGHSVDFLINSLIPSVKAKTESESDYISRSYDSKPTHDKEEFAHRYARDFFQKNKDKIPFNRIYIKENIESMCLIPEWFNYENI